MRAPALLLIAAAVLVTACSPAAGPGSAPVPSPDADPLPRRMLIVGNDPSLRFEVEVADEEHEMAKGLMGRPSLPANYGMVFLFDTPTRGSFWMKDTLIPLTIAFWDEQGAIVSILEMQPCTAEPCPLYGPGHEYIGALEVNPGELEGVQVGDRISLEPLETP